MVRFTQSQTPTVDHVAPEGSGFLYVNLIRGQKRDDPALSGHLTVGGVSLQLRAYEQRDGRTGRFRRYYVRVVTDPAERPAE